MLSDSKLQNITDLEKVHVTMIYIVKYTEEEIGICSC